MKEFDLNIEKVLEDWTVADALREIISNALDEQVLTQSKDVEIYFDDDDFLHIRDYGRGLNYTHFTQNENMEKLQHPNLIGKFGVGLKDALATFDRNGRDVRVDSMYGCFTLGKSQKHGFDDLLTLHTYIYPPTDINFKGTDFIISDCLHADLEIAKSKFVKFSEADMLEITKYGEIYEKTEDNADIFINGVKVAEESNFLFSYNITSPNSAIKKALNRERSNVGRSAYAERVKSILLNVEENSVIDLMIENLGRYSQGLLSDEMKWVDVSAYAAKKLNARENVIFMTPSQMENASTDNIDIIRRTGKEIVFIPETVKEKVEDIVDDNDEKITTFDTVIDDYRSSFEYDFVNYSDLTEHEMDVLSLSKYITGFYSANEFLDKIEISETMRPDDDLTNPGGVWDPNLGKIIIKRSQLSTVFEFAGTFTHELIHAKKGLHDVTREFERELTGLLGMFVASTYSKNLLLEDNQIGFSTDLEEINSSNDNEAIENEEEEDDMKYSNNSLEAQLERIRQRTQAKIAGMVCILDLLPDSFMQKNTRFSSLQEFLDESGFSFVTQKDFNSVEIDDLNKAVRKFTSYSDWNDFISNGAKEYVSNCVSAINNGTFVKPVVNTDGIGLEYIYCRYNPKVAFV